MRTFYILFPIILPILFGAWLYFCPIPDRRRRNLTVETVVILNSLLSLFVLRTAGGVDLDLFTLYPKVNILFHIDGLGTVFAAIITLLWPFATLYAFEYMEHEERENTFFAFYTMTYGVTLGIAYAGNIMTMYLFYEMLTLVTIPLVMHTMTPKARAAGRKYAYYSIGGAAFAFISLIFITVYGDGQEFAFTGVMSGVTHVDPDILRFIYVMAFLGFGVKAAIFPLHSWLIAASVAPTPVTALLHAVAVVKAGVFAVLRLTYYCFGTDLLRGTWAQAVVMLLAMCTIIYGSIMAVKERHFKRRLAYSTIANLSYILMATALMSPLGLKAAMTHIVAHAIGKICAFFVAGAVLVKSGYSFLSAMTGVGIRMRKTFIIFVVAAMSLTGVPITLGFVSKWQIAEAAFHEQSLMGYGVVLVLLLAAMCAAIYLFSVVVRALRPPRRLLDLLDENVADPGWRMLLPLGVFMVTLLVLGVYSGPLITYLEKIAFGVI